MEKLKCLFLIFLLNTTCSAQEPKDSTNLCSTPKIAYLLFAGSSDKRMVAKETEIGREFYFGDLYPEVFQAQEKGVKIDSADFLNLHFYSLKDLIDIENKFVECKQEHQLPGDPIFIPLHENIFEKIYVLEKIDCANCEHAYLRYDVEWLNIEYD